MRNIKLILRNLIIISLNYVYRFLEKFINIFKSFSGRKLYVFLLHSTEKKYFSEYYNLLKNINSKYPFINPSQIDDFYNGKLGYQSKSILTFDDGYKDNLLFSKKVLDPLGIKAIFFIIPFFINKKNPKLFFKSLFPNNKLLPSDLIRFRHLSVKDVKELTNNGHQIGMHGFKHESATKFNIEKFKNLILDGINLLRKYSITTIHYSYPFGSKKFFNTNTNKLLGSYFKYIHLGVRGENSPIKNNVKVVRRHTIASMKNNFEYKPYSYEEFYFFAVNSLAKNFIDIYHKIKI